MTSGLAYTVGDRPPVQLLSNSRYAVMVDAAGAGYSRWCGLAITRWHEDAVGDHLGSFVLLRDEDTGETWSTGVQPYGNTAGGDEVAFGEGHASITRRHGSLSSTIAVVVADGFDGELRQVTIGNHGDAPRNISLTSYAELVLGPAGADAAHPAFSKMFVQTEWVEECGVLLATRRRREVDEPEVWAAHFARVEGLAETTREFESDRMRFLGRGRTLRDALAMQPGAVLSNRSGCVLDPVFSLRRQVRVEPGASVRVSFWTAVSDSRGAALAILQPLGSAEGTDEVFSAAQARADAELDALGIDIAQAERFSRLAGALLVPDARLRAPADVIEQACGGAPVLWPRGISGDRPIALMRVDAEAGLENAGQLLLAQRYWHARRLGIDVVLLNSTGEGADDVQTQLDACVERQSEQLKSVSNGVSAEVFALRDSELGDELRTGLAAAARLVLDASAGLPQAAPGEADAGLARDVKKPSATPPAQAALAGEPLPRPPREFDNGIGGFSDGGRTYEITLDDGRCTPLPWVNVVANPCFGFVASAEGGGYTWSINSQKNPLTPWPNDPVSDTPHEALYLRDEDSGDLWTATALPIRVPGATYTIEHGKGYSRFRHQAHGVDVELLQSVPVSDSVKLSRLRLHNRSGRARRLSITGYVQWALRPNGQTAAASVITSRDAATGALFARNAWRDEFAERTSFIDLGGRQTAHSGDRLEFLGRHGGVREPASLIAGAPLSGRTGAGLDPCGALQTSVELAPDGQIELVFALGDAESEEQARALVEKYRKADLDAVLDEVREQWNALLDTVQVSTPDRSMDILLNDWLLYQSLSCRVWARSAYYQSSGAYGYRDQLQDVTALCTSRPDIAREHLLRAGGRQFPEGDVQHWWLPPSGAGIRTRIRDDRLWLPYVAAHYVATSGDTAVLDESLPFLQGAELEEGATDAFFQPETGDEQVSLYEHAARAIDSSLTVGPHGLPLIGTGDWNDGMNEVGAKGRGESVWMGWFVLATIEAFAPHAQARGEPARLATWHAYAAKLKEALEGPAGWDGDWYRRGYYDDGTPLGSQQSEECRIDTIAQSWSLISGAGDPDHAARAMASVDEHLIDHDNKLALLFTPPFDRGAMNPGYIKGYPPGIRENGGQYTHGATWAVFAYAKLGQGTRAAELFDILNPIRHSDSAEAAERYQVEPYAACADVYSVDPYVGRGGWTWYTGSAAWIYRAGMEAILGFRVQGDHLLISPCIPASWPAYRIAYRHRGPNGEVTRYEISVENPQGVHRGVALVELDGAAPERAAHDPFTARIPLGSDGAVHQVRVVLG
ncbi:MAG: glycosyl transferase family 36 [Pseudomonadota bacterium]|nr:glycosyl transferase family 36 [Pseudomonadota bacterium]